MSEPILPLIPPIAPAANAGAAAVATAAQTTPDWRKPSFDFLADSTKQLITVATGVVTATVLFSKDIDPTSKHWALAAWVVLTASVVSGISVLFNMSGNLHSAAEGTDPKPSVMATGIPFFSICQIVTFGIGMILVILFGLFSKPIPTPQPAEPKQSITVTCVTPPAPDVKDSSDKLQDVNKSSGKKQLKKSTH